MVKTLRGMLILSALLPFALAIENAPVLSVGDAWTYDIKTALDETFQEKDTVLTIEKCGEKECYVFGTESPKETTKYWMTRDWELVRLTGTSEKKESFDFVYTPAIAIYSFPLTTGKRWEWKSTFSGYLTDSRGERFNYNGTIDGVSRKVVSTESITVPAGTFDTLVIEHYSGGILSRRVWFSPVAKEAVKFEFYNEGQLVLSGVLASYAQGSTIDALRWAPFGIAAVVIVVVSVFFIRKRRMSRGKVGEGSTEKS